MQASIPRESNDYSWATWQNAKKDTDQHFLQDTHRFCVGHGVSMRITEVSNRGQAESVRSKSHLRGGWEQGCGSGEVTLIFFSLRQSWSHIPFSRWAV